MKHLTIPVSAIHPNPHRDFKRNPVSKDQVDKIVDSIGRTGFWDNVVVREYPGRKGAYQLAYGHSRLQAVKDVGITEVRLPVADLSDWDMYCAMVDENETQQEVTPKIAFENVEAGLVLLEKAFKAIGSTGTFEQFNAHLGRSVSADTERGHYDHGFEKARKGFFDGDGIGRVFVTEVLPGAKLRTNAVSAVLTSHYGKQRAEAKRKKADAKRKRAEAKRKEAQAEKDKEEAEQLQREAEEADREADQLAAEAEKIGKGTIAPEILLAFDTTNQMTDFAAAIKAAGVPATHHRAALEHVKEKEAFGKKMAEVVDLWWYEASGQGRKDRARRAKEEAFKRFRKRVKEGDLNEYLRTLGGKVKALTADLKIAQDAAGYCEVKALRSGLTGHLRALIDQAQRMVDTLTAEVIDAETLESGDTLGNGARISGLLT